MDGRKKERKKEGQSAIASAGQNEAAGAGGRSLVSSPAQRFFIFIHVHCRGKPKVPSPPLTVHQR